jgi:ring-1,2-phenylacetyl-CoA epoxidase subunit PaaC
VTLSEAAREHLLALADDEHLIGARHTQWIGVGPFLEEDLAFCSIAQDELGHALALYELVVDDPGDIDRFALLRDRSAYRSCWLAEAACTEWSDALVRHWLYDRAEAVRWSALARCPDPAVAAVAERARREESFHLAHADRLMADIASSTDPSPVRRAIVRLAPLAWGVWDPLDSEPEAVAEGFVDGTSAELSERWADEVRTDLARWGLDADAVDAVDAADRERTLTGQQHRTARGPAFDELADELRAVVSIDPAAIW